MANTNLIYTYIQDSGNAQCGVWGAAPPPPPPPPPRGGGGPPFWGGGPGGFPPCWA